MEAETERSGQEGLERADVSGTNMTSSTRAVQRRQFTTGKLPF